jgi:uncharacterized LabA/DUF88 family protein
VYQNFCKSEVVHRTLLSCRRSFLDPSSAGAAGGVIVLNTIHVNGFVVYLNKFLKLFSHTRCRPSCNNDFAKASAYSIHERKAASFIYVDVSNIVGEVSERKKKSGRIDFETLARCLPLKQKLIKRKILIGSCFSQNQSGWTKKAKIQNFEVLSYPRNSSPEKCVDTGLTALALKDCYEQSIKGDEFVIVSGDLDYLPLLEILQSRGIIVTVISWDSGISPKLRSQADVFQSLTELVALTQKPSVTMER